MYKVGDRVKLKYFASYDDMYTQDRITSTYLGVDENMHTLASLEATGTITAISGIYDPLFSSVPSYFINFDPEYSYYNNLSNYYKGYTWGEYALVPKHKFKVTYE